MNNANLAKWQSAKNVLCVRLDAIGDVLMTAPAVRAVKGEKENRRVTLLTSKSGAQAARLVPEIDEIIEYQSPWMKATENRQMAAGDLTMIENLRERKFDACVIFTVYSQNPLPAALLCYLAEIPLRLAHCRENPYQLLTDWAREIEPEQTIRHEVRRQLDLAAEVGFKTSDERMSISVSETAEKRIRQILSESKIETDSRSWLIVHAGATAASRRYPPEKFAAACRILGEKHHLRLVFTGSAEEIALVETIRRDLSDLETVSLAGKIDFEELATLVSLAPVLISNNSSPVHLASATGTPVVDLYALTNPQHTPWRVANRVLFANVPCGFCYKSICPEKHHDCLEKIEPPAIVQAALQLLAENRVRNPKSKIENPKSFVC